MREDKSATLSSSLLFVTLFVIAALAFTIWSYQRIPHHILLHINGMWRVHLIGEGNIDNVRLETRRLKVVKRDSANLWLEGTGTLTWQSHTIKVYKAVIFLNKHSFSKNMREPIVNIMFFPEGAVQKGALSTGPAR